MNFDQAFTKLLGHEGGYSNHPNDPGGETMWGITVKVARENLYAGEMRDMPQMVAKAIYKARYWDKVHADSLPVQVRFSVFDMAVNSGVSAAIKILQRSLSVKDDGIIGPKTLDAASKADAVRLAVRFNAHRLNLMTDLNNWPTFSRGWARRVATNLLEI